MQPASNTITRTGYITVSKSDSAPVANFVANVTSGTIPLSVQFVDSSTNTPTSWVWSFGDGGSSTVQNPSHTYTSPGTYTVTLTATSAAGSNTLSEPGYITASKVAALPVASFAATETSGTAPLTVQFVDSSTNTPTSWLWSFGDGSSSTLQDPSHTYTSVGTYTVTLTATNAAGSNTDTGPAISASISPYPSRHLRQIVHPGLNRLRSISRILQRILPLNGTWSFGDGDTSSDQNVTHTYTNTGTYTVELTAYNSAGSNITSASDYITVVSDTVAPKVSFTADVVQGAVPLTVQFTDTSENSPTSWLWSFGDGVSSILENPSHTYSASGTYTVRLIAANGAGSNTLTRSGYILVTEAAITTLQTSATATPTPTLTEVTESLTPTPAAEDTVASSSGGSSGILPVTGYGNDCDRYCGMDIPEKTPRGPYHSGEGTLMPAGIMFTSRFK